MKLSNRLRLIIGAVMLISGILLSYDPNKLGLYIYLFFYPVQVLFVPNDPQLTISFLLIYTAIVIILYLLLEGNRKHGWTDLLQNLFLLLVLTMDHYIMYFDTTSHLNTHYGAYLILLDGFLVFCLAFIVPWLRGGHLSRQVIYWVYLIFGILIMSNSFYGIPL